jgi:hypothetical protein
MKSLEGTPAASKRLNCEATNGQQLTRFMTKIGWGDGSAADLLPGSSCLAVSHRISPMTSMASGTDIYCDLPLTTN